MPWYGYLLLAALIVAPFDALYLYIQASRRRDARRRGDGVDERRSKPPEPKRRKDEER